MRVDILRRLREKKGLTQSEAAKRMGIVRTTYSNYEAGNREPDNDTLKKFAEFYGVSVDYLLGIEDAVLRESAAQYITNDQARNDVIEAYNRLPHDKKKLVDDMIKALLDDKK